MHVILGHSAPVVARSRQCLSGHGLARWLRRHCSSFSPLSNVPQASSLPCWTMRSSLASSLFVSPLRSSPLFFAARPHRHLLLPPTSSTSFTFTSASAPEQPPPSPSSLSQLIKDLRSATGAPMMECKKALTDPSVDFDMAKAIQWLRKHGAARASSKVSMRNATEGMVGVLVSNDGQKASIVTLTCETDFASRSESFGRLVQCTARAALGLDLSTEKRSGDGSIDVADVILSASIGRGTNNNNKDDDDDDGINDEEEDETAKAAAAAMTVKQCLDETVLAIRENLTVSSASLIHATSNAPSDSLDEEANYIDSILVSYVHGRLPGSRYTAAGTLAAVVEIGRLRRQGKEALTSTSTLPLPSLETMKKVGKKLAMHVVAAKPLYLDPNSVPSHVVEKEMAIIMEQVAEQSKNKPREIVDKIVHGRMSKFYNDVCLKEQPHMVEEGNPKVSSVLEQIGLEVRNFERASVAAVVVP